MYRRGGGGGRYPSHKFSRLNDPFEGIDAMTDAEYVLIQDDDGHWYVCPAGKRQEASPDPRLWEGR